MNVFIVSIPNELEEKYEFEMNLNNFLFALSNDNMISAKKLGLKTSMDFRGLVWKRVWKVTFYGLKSGQYLMNRAAHPTKNSQEYPYGDFSV